MNDVATTYVSFFATVNGPSITRLTNVVEEKLRAGTKRFVILISTPGGSVFHGLSAHNYLRGLPAEVVTHNFGSVDSIGVVLYCAGSTRLSVPNARFLLHGVQTQFAQNMSLEEPQLEERLKGMRIDIENMAGVIAGTVGCTEGEVREMMLARTTMNPTEAREWGLVHDIRAQLFPAGADLVSISDS